MNELNLKENELNLKEREFLVKINEAKDLIEIEKIKS